MLIMLVCVQNTAAARQTNLFGGQTSTSDRRGLLIAPIDTLPLSYGLPAGYGFPGYGVTGYGGYGGLAIESYGGLAIESYPLVSYPALAPEPAMAPDAAAFPGQAPALPAPLL